MIKIPTDFKDIMIKYSPCNDCNYPENCLVCYMVKLQTDIRKLKEKIKDK